MQNYRELRKMKIRLNFEKTNLIRLIVAMIFAAVLYYKVTFPVYVLAGFGACYFPDQKSGN